MTPTMSNRLEWELPLVDFINKTPTVQTTVGVFFMNRPKIVDISYGEWEGKPLEEVRKNWPDLCQLWVQEPHKVIFPGGESLDGVRSRTMEAIKRLVKKHKDENIALVAHRVPNKVICCALLGIDNSHFWRIQQEA